MNLKDRYEGWTAADIVAMKGVAQENRHLDFKLLGKPEFGPDDQRHLAKAVSGFANAEGGVIVWGVDARPDPDDEYIDQVVATPGVANARQILAKLNNLSPDASSPGVRGLDHRIIVGAAELPSFVATFVPEGESGPYMTMLKEARHRYYRRIGSSFSPMDHGMVADMFGRRAQPMLQVECRPESSASLNLRAIVTNVGRGIARAPYLMLRAREPLSASPSMDTRRMPWAPGLPGWHCFAEGMDGVIHPRLARQWLPLQTRMAVLTHEQRKATYTISYRLGAAGLPEVCGVVCLTFEPSCVISHEHVHLSQL